MAKKELKTTLFEMLSNLAFILPIFFQKYSFQKILSDCQFGSRAFSTFCWALALFTLFAKDLYILREKSLSIIYTWVSHRRSLKH